MGAVHARLRLQPTPKQPFSCSGMAPPASLGSLAPVLALSPPSTSAPASVRSSENNSLLLAVPHQPCPHAPLSHGSLVLQPRNPAPCRSPNLLLQRPPGNSAATTGGHFPSSVYLPTASPCDPLLLVSRGFLLPCPPLNADDPPCHSLTLFFFLSTTFLPLFFLTITYMLRRPKSSSLATSSSY